ncbi:MAG: integrase family protein [Magnetococcales bacterium]|nr:integrase family protein [Magnetococcales bacterium]
MATIQERISQDGTTSYRVQVRLKGHPMQTATFARKTDAKKWASQTESAIREGRHFHTTEAKRHTLGELIDRYFSDVMPSKPKSAQDQTRQLDWWKSELGNNSLADCTPSLLAEYRDRLAKGEPQGTPRSPGTVNRYLAALSHAFTIAVKEWEWLEANPLSKVRKPQEPRGRVRFLSDDERERLLAACRESLNPFLYPVVVLALACGMREGEILGLTWDAVDLEQGRIILHETKNGERRLVPLTGHALAVLKEFSKVRRLDTPLLFPSKGNRSGAPMIMRSPWVAALKKSEISDFHFHDLRHSCASYLAMNGASMTEIAEVLGHKTLQMVKRYSHLSEAHTADVVARMNAKIFGGTLR